MIIGGHFPTSGGLSHTVDLVLEAGGNTLQIFSKNPGQWNANPIDGEAAREFVDLCRVKKISPVVIHDSYLINMASGYEDLRKKSVFAMIDEISRAEMLGGNFVVTHMGAHKGLGVEKGLENLAKSVNEVLNKTENSRVKILLENGAGQGTQLGTQVFQIARVLEKCGNHTRVGICFDTCHAFAAGYNLSDEAEYEKMMAEIGNIGFERLMVLHVNDSLRKMGGRIDRHTHIGKGYIGLEAFRRMINDPRLSNIPMIVETPEPEMMHAENIALLKSLKNIKNE